MKGQVIGINTAIIAQGQGSGAFYAVLTPPARNQ